MNEHYLDRDEVYIDICFWKTKIYAYDDTSIRPPDSIGEPIQLSTEGLSRRVNFYRYTWKEDMVGNGIESMVKGMFNFNEQKWFNPHAYMSRAAENAFLQTLEKENRELLATYKTFLTSYKEDYENEGYISSTDNEQFVQDMQNKVVELEEKINRKKVRRKLLKMKRDMKRSPLTDMVFGDDVYEKIDDEIKKTETFYSNREVSYGERGKLLIRVKDIKEEMKIEIGSLCVEDIIEYMTKFRNMDIDEEQKMGNLYVDITFLTIDDVEYVEVSWGQ